MMVNLPCLMESCSNFLRPTCSYTECRLSFQTGACPTERTPVSYSSCFYFILTNLHSPMEICLYSGRFLPCSCLLVLLLMQCLSLLHRCRVTFQNPARIRSCRIPARSWNYDAVCFVMLPVSSAVPIFLCLTKASSDHMSLPLSVTHKLPVAVCRLSLSVTASFLTDYPALASNIHAVP